MAAPTKQPKSMSSRLAGMKFMQRGAASSPPASPMGGGEPAAKKQRLSSGGFTASTARSESGNAALEEAVASQERKRAEAVAREGEMKGETKWYLSVQKPQKPVVESPLRIVSAGYSALDSVERKGEVESEEEEGEEEGKASRPHMPGRISFGKFGRTEKKKTEEDDEDSDSEDDSDDDPEGAEQDISGVDSLIAQGRKEATARIRAERKEQKRAANAEAARLAEKRRAKELDLNRPTSISNAGAKKEKDHFANMVCHTCGEKGHGKKDCPKKRGQRPSKLRQSY